MWNHHVSKGARTINAAESFRSFYSKINRQSGKKHLNVFALIELLQCVQRESEIEIQRLKSGGPPLTPRRKYKVLEEKIERLKNNLAVGQISLLQFMDSIAYVFHLED